MTYNPSAGSPAATIAGTGTLGIGGTIFNIGAGAGGTTTGYDLLVAVPIVASAGGYIAKTGAGRPRPERRQQRPAVQLSMVERSAPTAPAPCRRAATCSSTPAPSIWPATTSRSAA